MHYIREAVTLYTPMFVSLRIALMFHNTQVCFHWNALISLSYNGRRPWRVGFHHTGDLASRLAKGSTPIIPYVPFYWYLAQVSFGIRCHRIGRVGRRGWAVFIFVSKTANFDKTIILRCHKFYCMGMKRDTQEIYWHDTYTKTKLIIW